MDTNNDFNQELEEMYNFALDQLKKNQHERVNEIFTYFFENDIRLKEKLAKAFSPKDESQIINPEKMQSLIILQSMHNNYHLNLFNSITDQLIDMFQEALKQMEDNLEEGSRISFEAQKMVRYYEVKLEKLMAPIETIQGSLYNDLKQSYKLITNRRNDMITKFTQKVIAKETELMEKNQE